MQNDNCKFQIGARRGWLPLHFEICILHFAICNAFLVTILAVLASPARAQDDGRAPVPKSSAQGPVLRQVKEQFRAEYAKHDPADQLALSKEFRTMAAASAKDDRVRQYVLLREARELAVNAGDFDAAFGTIDDMTQTFRLDPRELKVTALTDAMDRARIEPRELLQKYLKIADQGLLDADVTLAAQASLLATKIARGTRDPVAVQQAKQMDLRIHDARRELTQVIAAANRLRANSEDPEANLTTGRYICFAQGKWDEGLPLLAKGSDKRLRDLAEKDLDSPSDAKAMADLADAWWDLPETKQTPSRRSRQRAAYWYAKAVPGLSGERKTTAEQRARKDDKVTR